MGAAIALTEIEMDFLLRVESCIQFWDVPASLNNKMI